MDRNIYPVDRPMPCYNKDGKKIGWFNPRFLCTALFVFAWSKEHKEWCVLSSIRGDGAESFKGLVNCPCGYMDINITAKENAVKETFEECGVKISPDDIQLVGIEDSPEAYQQHITMRYMSIIKDIDAGDIAFSHDGNEIDADGNLEVGAIAFIPLSKVNTLHWAFNHNKIIWECAKKKHLDWATKFKKIKQLVKTIF